MSRIELGKNGNSLNIMLAFCNLTVPKFFIVRFIAKMLGRVSFIVTIEPRLLFSYFKSQYDQDLI